MPKKRVRHGMNLSIIVGLTLVVMGLGLVGLYYAIDEDNVISEVFDENGDQDEDDDTGNNDTGEVGINYSDSIIFSIEDAIHDNLDDFYGQTIQVQVFQIPYERYIFGIDVYLTNHTASWPPADYNASFQIRDGLYDHPRSNSSGILYQGYHIININEPQWVTLSITSDLRLSQDTDYYFYLDLMSLVADKDYRWGIVYDSVNGDNATYNYALSGLDEWVNYTIYEVDYLMTLNLSKS